MKMIETLLFKSFSDKLSIKDKEGDGMTDSIKSFEALLRHQFRNPSLLEEALTHRSFFNNRKRRKALSPSREAAPQAPLQTAAAASPPAGARPPRQRAPEEPFDNQRLEFLGDAVLSLVAADMLMKKHPEAQEGSLTKKRAELVSGEALARTARQIKIHHFLRTDNVQESSNRRLLTDALEACIGAVYLDAGFEKAKEIAERLFADSQNNAEKGEPAAADYKSLFQEWSQKNLQANPVYKLISAEGPEHQKSFLMEAVLQEEPAGSGRGKTKKAAEQAAAKQALQKFNIPF